MTAINTIDLVSRLPATIDAILRVAADESVPDEELVAMFHDVVTKRYAGKDVTAIAAVVEGLLAVWRDL